LRTGEYVLLQRPSRRASIVGAASSVSAGAGATSGAVGLIPAGLAVLLLCDQLHVLPIPGLATLAIAALIWLTWIVRRATPTTFSSRPSIASVALLAVVLLSVLWSDLPLYSAERLRTFGPALAAAWLSGASSTGAEFRFVMKWFSRISFGSAAVLVLVSSKAREAIGAPPGWHAQFDKNDLGLILAFCFICTIILERGRARVAGLVTILVLSAGNESRTSQIAIVAIAGTLASLAWLRGAGWHTGRARLSLLGLVSSSVLLICILARDWVFVLLGKNPTLSERTDIWHAAEAQIAKAPILGHGAFAFLEVASNSPTRQAVARYFNNFVPPHAHNAVLDLIGQVGLLGLLVYLAALASLVARSMRLRDGRLKTYALLVIGFLLLCGLVEPTFLSPWLLVAALIDGQVSRASTPRHSGSRAEDVDPLLAKGR
jgi:exopolysaccharide production protein ExoQ